MKNLSSLKDKIQKLDKSLVKRVAERDLYRKQVKDREVNLGDLLAKERQYKQVSLLFNEVFNMLRESMKHNIENVVTSALQDILQDRTMVFMMRSKKSHDKIVTDFIIRRETGAGVEEFDPMNEMGGGIVDILSLALRVVVLTMHKQSLSQILILDEALTSLSNFSYDTIDRTAQWLRAICEANQIQLVMVTQKEAITEVTHKSFKMNNVEGISRVMDK